MSRTEIDAGRGRVVPPPRSDRSRSFPTQSAVSGSREGESVIPAGVRGGKPVKRRLTSGTVRPVPGLMFAGLLAVFCLEYLRPGNYFPPIDVLKLNTILPLGVAAMTFFSREGRPHDHAMGAPSTKWFIVVLLLFGVQMFTSDVRLYVFEILKGFVGYLLLYYVIVRQVTTLARLRAVMLTLILVHLVTLGLYPNVILEPEARHTLGGSFLGDGNDFAWSVCVVIPFALFLASSSERKGWKYFYYGVFVLLMLAVVGTQSRGSSIALLSAICYLASQSKERVLALTGLAALIAVVAAFAPTTYFERLETVTDWRTEGSAQGRILAWKTATSMALDHPITGVGAGHYSVKFGFEYKPDGYRGPYLNTHSIYFTMLAEFGFPGLVVLVALTLGNIMRNQRLIGALRRTDTSATAVTRKLMTAMQASLIGYMVAGAFLSGVFYPHLFVLAALMESARYIVRTEIRRQPEGARTA